MLGWDPAFRTGCKLAVVDPTGKVIGHDCNLSDSAYDSEEDPGSKRSAEKDYSKVSHLFDFPGKWNSIQRIRTVYCRTVKRDSGKSAVCDRK